MHTGNLPHCSRGAHHRAKFALGLVLALLAMATGCASVAASGSTVDAGPTASASPTVDASCKVDADCAVKDVGSCCGVKPACLNKDSPTFVDQVRAQCANEGRVGVCGFQPVRGCQCVSGKCTAQPVAVDGLIP